MKLIYKKIISTQPSYKKKVSLYRGKKYEIILVEWSSDIRVLDPMVYEEESEGFDVYKKLLTD